MARLCRPSPQLALGQALVGQASACIDISDGLLADLQHMLTASGQLGATLDGVALLALLETSSALAELDVQTRLSLALQAGDDYLLLFTLPAKLPIPAGCHAIGRVDASSGLRLQDLDGVQPLTAQGWQHF